MAFIVDQTIDLSYLGESWKGCAITFHSPTYRQVSGLASDPDKASEKAMDLLKEMFVSGKGFDGKEVVDMGADDIADLPMLVVSKCLEQLAGKVSPKEDGN